MKAFFRLTFFICLVAFGFLDFINHQVLAETLKQLPLPNLNSNLNCENSLRQKLATTEKEASGLGIRLKGNMSNLGQDKKISYLEQAILELRKIPKDVFDVIRGAGFTLDLVWNSIVDHPGLDNLRGYTPPGYPTGYTCDFIVGFNSPELKASVVAANKIQEARLNNNSYNLVLHEHAHGFDRAALLLPKNAGVPKLAGQQMLTQTDPEWLSVWKGTAWIDYYRSMPWEAFAESFAYYFDSEQSRDYLKNTKPLVYEYFQKHFLDSKEQ